MNLNVKSFQNKTYININKWRSIKLRNIQCKKIVYQAEYTFKVKLYISFYNYNFTFIYPSW